jgi:glycosyltransferase involved in cell wall biosynthesis
MAWLHAVTRDVMHVQWLAAPQFDDGLFRPRGPLVFTAHDLLPRRTARRERLWRRLLRRFDRVVVHSENGREMLAAYGVEPERLHVVPHPVFRSDPQRTDDGATVLALGAIRPYKGIGDAVE